MPQMSELLTDPPPPDKRYCESGNPGFSLRRMREIVKAFATAAVLSPPHSEAGDPSLGPAEQPRRRAGPALPSEPALPLFMNLTAKPFRDNVDEPLGSVRRACEVSFEVAQNPLGEIHTHPGEETEHWNISRLTRSSFHRPQPAEEDAGRATLRE